MSEMPEIGKISPEIFSELIFPRLGAKSDKNPGRAAAWRRCRHRGNRGQAVSLPATPFLSCRNTAGKGRPGLPSISSPRIPLPAASSLKYLSIDLNLPMEMTKKQLETVWDTIHQQCVKLGIAVITGHTARYEGCHYPMVGGATIVGVGELDEYVTPRFCKAGDKMIITKGPAIEATGIFGRDVPQSNRKGIRQRDASKSAGKFFTRCP